MEFEVLKLGGSILKDRETFDRAAEIVENKLSQGIVPVCVVSAMKGVTDQIIGAHTQGRTNQQSALFILG